MKTIKVTTGFGYFTKNGKIDSKAELPKGEHPAGDEYEYHEVKNKTELDKVKVYQEPPTKEEQEQIMIADKKQEILERQARAELIEEGKLKR
jgi:hypothetical protein